MCDVDVDVEMRMVFGSEQRREQTEKQRRKREKISWEKKIIKYFFFYNTVNSVILCLKLYCSSIAKKFTILLFIIP